MTTKLISSFIVFLSILALLSSSALSTVDVSTGIDHYWCNKTPYPEACKTTFARKHYSNPKDMTDFKNLVIQATMEDFLKAQSQIKLLGHKFRTEKDKAAWSHCLELYQRTIKLLNHTFDPSTNCTEFDSQTWLSTALTNLETCRTELVELEVSDFVLPRISNYISKLITNILSFENGSVTPPVTNQYTNTFGSPLVNPGVKRLLQFPPAANLVVAQDGSGNCTTINDALNVAQKISTGGTNRIVIYIKKGIYNEYLDINLTDIYLVGDGMASTIITGNRSWKGGYKTFYSATVAVTGDRFIARGITFRNTAGPENEQAVALRCDADLAVFYGCGFEGYQDTLYTYSNRQFYKNCDIYGTVDFIFGHAMAVFQNCNIYARKPINGQQNTITAQGCENPYKRTGIVIQNSRIMAARDLRPFLGLVKTYLGRPWKMYSQTVFLHNYIGSLVDPAGWLEWKGNFALDTLYYGEYINFGPGSGTSKRVKWGGYRVINTSLEASKFTVDNFIAGSSWLPATGVPFTPGL